MKICVPIQATSLEVLKEELLEAEKVADLVEIWLDSISNLKLTDIPQIIKMCKKPFLCVCKGRKEKGNFRGSEQKRLTFLKEAFKAGADYVDVGLHTPPHLIKELINVSHKGKLIISHHDFSKTPSLKSLQNIAAKQFSLGADIIKIATFANAKDDNAKIYELIRQVKAGKIEHSKAGKRGVIALCMGKLGQESRIKACDFGALWMFAPLKSKQKTAPGQLTVKELRSLGA